MDNSKNYTNKAINEKNKIIYQKRDNSMILSNKNNLISERNNLNKKTNYIIDNKKKIIKSKLLIPNSKCQFKKTNKTAKQIQESTDQKIILNKKINKELSRRQSCGIIKRNKNYQLFVSNSSGNSPNKNKNKNVPIKSTKKSTNNTNNTHINSVKKEKINLIQKIPKKISLKLKNNYYIKNTSENNYNNIGIKIIDNDKKREIPLCVAKMGKRENILNNNINNNNFNGNITYNNNVNLNFNKKDNIIYDIPNIPTITDIPKNLYINNKEANIIKKNISQNYSIENDISIIKRNKLIRIPIIQNDFSDIKKEFPNNYSYHEITHLNSPNRANRNYKERVEFVKPIYISTKERSGLFLHSMGNKKVYSQKESYNANNVNKMASNNNYLVHNQSFSHFKDRIPVLKFPNPNYSTVFSNRRQYFRNNIFNNLNEDYNYISENNVHLYRNRSFNNLKNIFLSPKNSKLDYSERSDRYMEIENEEIPEIPQKINYFGEEMLKRNKNYNFPKYENPNKSNYIPISILSEKKYNNKKIKLKKKHNSYNNIHKKIKLNNVNDDFLKECLSFQKDKDKSIYISPEKIANNNISGKKSDFNSVNKIQKIKRYSHNIINRKKIKKLIMEKSLNEEFISASNKKENKTSQLKDKISNYETSIIDNDSINEIILEFEKEIEDEEKKEKEIKDKNETKKGINMSNNDSIKFSYISDNDFSFLSKDSTNNSKIKKKIHYYKTKNVDMEKNYDFAIYGTKKNKSKK